MRIRPSPKNKPVCTGQFIAPAIYAVMNRASAARSCVPILGTSGHTPRKLPHYVFEQSPASSHCLQFRKLVNNTKTEHRSQAFFTRNIRFFRRKYTTPKCWGCMPIFAIFCVHFRNIALLSTYYNIIVLFDYDVLVSDYSPQLTDKSIVYNAVPCKFFLFLIAVYDYSVTPREHGEQLPYM